MVLQTLSKAGGMAGLRLGMAFAAPEVVALMSRVKYPYNINAVTQEIVAARLEEDISAGVRLIVSERRRIFAALEKLPAVSRVWPSDANFILARFPDPGMVYGMLIDAGIIVRDRSHIPGCEGCLRITVGTPEENDRLLDVLSGVLNGCY